MTVPKHFIKKNYQRKAAAALCVPQSVGPRLQSPHCKQTVRPINLGLGSCAAVTKT